MREDNHTKRQLLLAIVLVAAITPSAVAPPGLGSDPDRATDKILHVVSRLRGLEAKRPVKSRLKSREEIEKIVIRDLDEDTPPEELEATSKTLAKLGLIPKDFPLRDYMIRLLREQVAGLYEPSTKEFYLASWLPLSEQKPVIAHELTHALQDQHFNLRRFRSWPKGDSDAELAAHALVEGDATLIMLRYSAEQDGINLDITKIPSLTELLLANNSSEKYPLLDGAPAVLRETLQFPYVYGAGFVQHILKHGSQRILDQSFHDLPASTEQIMHPELFLTKEKPLRIEMADLLRALGPDWKLSDSDTNGEFGYLIILSEFIDKRAAARAAEGWGGDRYLLYENKKSGELLLAQYTTWDGQRDAREFFEAYSERTQGRYKNSSLIHSSPTARIYRTQEGLVSIEMRGQDVVIVEGAGNEKALGAILELLWQSQKK
jgi:hypothetical protein